MAHPQRSSMRRLGAAPVLAAAAVCAVGAASVSAASTVTSVTGSALGYVTSNITLFTAPQTPTPATPSVTLSADASNSPQTGSTTTGVIVYGPATLFTSDAIAVSTKGSLGASGSVTSTSDIKDVNHASTQTSTGSEQLTAPEISSSCTATTSGTSGAVTITSGTVATEINTSSTVVSSAPVPANPAPSYSVSGKIDLSPTDTETFTDIFNEQTVSGSTLTVTAVHEVLHGPTAKGDIYIGQSVCGSNAAPAAVSSSNPGTGANGVASASTPGTPTSGSAGGLNTAALAAIGAGAVLVLGSATTTVVRRRGRARRTGSNG